MLECPDLPDTPRWLVLVPIKSTAAGKSRIALLPPQRAAIARALARDTVTAVSHARRVRQVLVLVEDEADGRRLEVLGRIASVTVRASGLNESIAEAVATLDSAAGPVAVLPADLPSLDPHELDAALAVATGPLSVVADRQGIGTTLLAARRPDLLVPHYGGPSFAAHRAAGAAALAVESQSGLRRDVDTLEDLVDVTGSATRSVLAGLAMGLPAG